MKKSISCISFLILVDQIIKYLVSHNLNLGENVFINPIFQITYVKNYGAAWNILENQRIFLIIFTSSILFFLLKFLKKVLLFDNKWLISSMILIISGAIGNLIDRIIFGYVIDMIQLNFINFPIFNLADIFLCIGVFMVIINILFGKEDYFG